MKQTVAFVAGILVAWLISCAADASGEKRDEYYRSPLECGDLQDQLDACIVALGRKCSAPE